MMRRWVLVPVAAFLVVLGALTFHVAAQPTFSGRWLMEFPKDDPPRSYSCAVYQLERSHWTGTTRKP